MERGQDYRARDLISREGAEILAYELTAYWHQRGYTEVQHWVEPLRAGNWHSTGTGEAKQAPIWCVRGNLIGGLPPRPLVPR